MGAFTPDPATVEDNMLCMTSIAEDDFGLSSLTNTTEGGDEMALQDIYKAVTVNDDLILVIDKDAEETLRKGLTAIKYKINKAAKDSGIGFDNRSLEFKVLPWTEEEQKTTEGVENLLKIQVYLKAKNAIRIHQMILTDKEF